MAEPAFPVGTIVYLKSGGVPLTVSDQIHQDNNLVDINWFAGDAFMRDVIHKDCLTTEKPNG